MRLTCDQNDPDFDDAKNFNAEVYLDGVKQTAIEADDAAGYVVRYTGRAAGDEWETEKVYGKVEIKLNVGN